MSKRTFEIVYASVMFVGMYGCCVLIIGVSTHSLVKGLTVALVASPLQAVVARALAWGMEFFRPKASNACPCCGT